MRQNTQFTTAAMCKVEIICCNKCHLSFCETMYRKNGMTHSCSRSYHIFISNNIYGVRYILVLTGATSQERVNTVRR